MCSHIGPDALTEIHQNARNLSPAESLAMLGAVAVGRPGFLACKGFCLHDPQGVLEVIDPTQPDRQLVVGETLDQATLAPLGLCFSATDHTPQSPAYLTKAIIALRLGLLMQCLDIAFRHLEGRESFGQKLLHFQLMKARFATTNADVTLMLTELTLGSAFLDDTAALTMHKSISRHFVQAAKLMGGHGLLAGKCHALEFLAGLILAMHLPDANPPQRATHQNIAH